MRGLVGKRHRHHRKRRDTKALAEMRDARGQYACFARTGAGQYQEMLAVTGDGIVLGCVQPSE